MKLRAALYLRGRPDDVSYAAQDDAHDLVQHRRWNLVDTFVDDESDSERHRRRGLHAMLDAVRAKRLDVVAVSSIHRIVGSLHELVVLVDLLRSYECGFASAREPTFDTAGRAGPMFLEVIDACAGFERDVKVGRGRLGLELARRRGTHIGRPQASFSVARARAMRESGQSLAAIAKALGTSKTAVHRRLVPKPSAE